MRTVEVPLEARAYPIHIGPGLLPSLGGRLAEACPAPTAAIISDDNVAPLYGKIAVASMKHAGYRTALMVIKAGEQSKSLAMASGLYGDLAKASIERTSPVISLGGGVVGDLTGFIAATWLRGVPFVQVPTTLEADVDAAVGGKTAVNHEAGKNLIGAFHQPRMVLIDTSTLATLGERDVRAGLAESVKHGVIRDAGLFAWHEANVEAILGRDEEVLAELIERNCRIKAEVVATDEREAGLRAILNFGHTIGHAIESDGHYALRHGECVAIGMVAAARIAVVREMIPGSEADRITALLDRLGLPTRAPRPVDVGVLMAYMLQDKKVAGGRIRFVLPTRIGEVVTVSDVSEEEIAAGVEAIQAE
ncbi:MAG: 3-dehydroquinate synthase [Phycisphaerae bacterium]|nr:3-dehydroquinate synthase [Phycisphaerae bacterium]